MNSCRHSCDVRLPTRLRGSHVGSSGIPHGTRATWIEIHIHFAPRCRPDELTNGSKHLFALERPISLVCKLPNRRLSRVFSIVRRAEFLDLIHIYFLFIENIRGKSSCFSANRKSVRFIHTHKISVAAEAKRETLTDVEILANYDKS